MTENIFNNQRAIPAKLTAFGFQLDANIYTYEQPLLDQAFTLTVVVTLPNTVTTTLIDQETGAPYTLHLVTNNTGDFVARVRKQRYKPFKHSALNRMSLPRNKLAPSSNM
ncbi:hypothetical protein [Lactiplantibacillus fabifermentans]|uniref:Uncharacterized protein n=1 Tax=Lactiplantibacillus fabifermentans DSM 21115 TaxID=1413187 RepID=A0A0R2NQC7_9LACO|nr:hypothetical protein [Lactiplantibacillus fabifermentans]KRO27870.1 hypothetical protein DY78_GL002820 [Lactiplantibacillus fabifermentans DSM 21115]